MGKGNAGFLFLPRDSYGNGNQIAYTNGNGTGIGIAQVGWERFLLMCFHLVIIFLPESIFDLIDL